METIFGDHLGPLSLKVKESIAVFRSSGSMAIEP